MSRIVQVPPEEFKELVLSMAKLNRQRFGGAGTIGLGPQSEHRCKPLASVGLSSDAKDPVRQVTRDGFPKDPVGKLLSCALPDKPGGPAPKVLGSGAVSLREMRNSILNSGPERAPKSVEI